MHIDIIIRWTDFALSAFFIIYGGAKPLAITELMNRLEIRKFALSEKTENR